MVAQVEQPGQGLRVQVPGDVLVGSQPLAEIAAFLPQVLGVALHHLVGLLPVHAGLGQRQQHALGEDQPAEAVEVGLHVLRMDHQLVDQLGEPGQRKVERDGGVGGDHPLDRGVGDVALVPQRHVLQRRDDLGADDASQPRQVLGQHRVALVGHGGGPLLAGGEILLGLAQLGALEVPDLGGQPLHGARDDGEGGEEGGVAVARDHLGRDRLDREPHLSGDMALHPGVDVGEGADRAGDGASGDLPAGGGQPLPVAGELRVMPGELEAEGGGFGMDAVAAADADRHLVLEGPALQGRKQPVQVGKQDVRGLAELHGEAGVQHVRGGHALMHEAGLGPDMLGQVGEKREDLVAGLEFDLVDAFDLEGAALANRARRLGRDGAELGLGVAGMGLDLEPDLVAVRGLPDRGHLRAAVARDHGILEACRGSGILQPAPAF